MRVIWLPWLMYCCLLAGTASAQQAVPTLSGHVIDLTHTLNTTQHQQLDQKLATFEAQHGAQIVVLLLPTTQPEDMAGYANRVANTWKIGRKGIGDGLLLVVALNDRKVRIEVAKTLEGALPDLSAQRIIDQSMTPNFKKGDYAQGLEAGTTAIMALIAGEALPAPVVPVGAEQVFAWHEFAILLFFIVPIVGALARSLLGNKIGTWITGAVTGGITLFFTASVLLAVLASVLAFLFSRLSPLPQIGKGPPRGGDWGRGPGGGWGGGGFRSGGGGDFGGGGASGRW